MNKMFVDSYGEPVKVICEKCAKAVESFQIDQDDILFRYYLRAVCHGQEEVSVVTWVQIKLHSFITAFRGDGGLN